MTPEQEVVAKKYVYELVRKTRENAVYQRMREEVELAASEAAKKAADQANEGEIGICFNSNYYYADIENHKKRIEKLRIDEQLARDAEAIVVGRFIEESV